MHPKYGQYYRSSYNFSDLKTITRFALLEYQLGDPERGKTIFEGIIDSHPKRFDLWVVYMDQEAKLGNIDALRYCLDTFSQFFLLTQSRS